MGIIRKIFAVDLRSLALFRIAVGCLLLADLFDRAGDLTAHYTDYGVMPRQALAGVFRDPLDWTFHTLGGSPLFEGVLFAAAAVFALLLALGWRTRLMSVLSWIFLVSLHHRNWFVLYGGDLFLRVMLFWGMFLPWHRKFSLDARREAPGPGPAPAVSLATAALLLQIAFVYLFTGILKAKDPSWQQGLGVYYALTLDTHARALGTWLLEFPTLVHWLSHATLFLEIAGPIFLLASFHRLRLLVIGAFVVFQSGLGLCLSLGLFPWISAAAMIPFLPPLFWRRILPSEPVPASPEMDPLPVRVFAAGSLAMILLWNIGTVMPLPFRNHPIWAWPRLLALNQGWVMFVSPRVTDGWYVIPGRLADGSEVDLFQGRRKIDWSRPRRISSSFKNLRWAKYMSNLWDVPPLRPYFAWFLCHRWNQGAPQGKNLKEIEVDYMLELTQPDNPRPEPKKIVMGLYLCSSKDH